MNDPRIGTRTDSGTQYPQATISGGRYSRPPLTVMGLDDTHFVVLDPFPRPGFDLEAALAECMALIAPVKPKARRDEPQDAGE